MNKEQAKEKVKLLLRLAANAPENEAKAAQAMADKLVEKYALTEEEYIEKEVKPLYTDDALLFEEVIATEWRPRLAFICANKFDCYAIQEENIAVLTGERVYKYFVYGHEDDVILTKALFKLVSSKIQELIDKDCKDKNTLYINSYAEGAVAGAKANIEYETFDIKGIIKTEKEELVIEANSEKAIEKIKEPKKEKPIEKTTELNAPEEKPIDIIAYWRGENEAIKSIHIGKIDYSKQYTDAYDNYDDDEEDKEFENNIWKKIKGIFKG